MTTAVAFTMAVFPGPGPQDRHVYVGIPRWNPDSLTVFELAESAKWLVKYGATRAYVVRESGGKRVMLYSTP